MVNSLGLYGIGYTLKKSLKELYDVYQGKESFVSQLSESHALIDSLKSKNTMLVETIKSLENELKEIRNS
jgi:hypothetical protein